MGDGDNGKTVISLGITGITLVTIQHTSKSFYLTGINRIKGISSKSKVFWTYRRKPPSFLNIKDFMDRWSCLANRL